MKLNTNFPPGCVATTSARCFCLMGFLIAGPVAVSGRDDLQVYRAAK
jgi:hypothetical protein